MFFAKYLAALLQSGITLDKGLSAIHAQSKSPAMRRILETLMADVASGEFLSNGLRRFPRAFDRLFTSLVEVGEQSGTLPESLSRIALHLEKSRELRGKVYGALFYPMIIVAGTIGIGAYLVFALLPQILPLFTSLRVELPWTTRLVIGTSKFILEFYTYVAIGGVACLVGIAFLLRAPPIRYAADWTLLRLPVLGSLFEKIQLAQLANMAGTLLKSGLTITDTLQITSGSMSNHVYRRGVAAMADAIQEGENITSFLEKHRTLFPGFVNQMIAVGEETGKLDESFLFVAGFAEKEADDAAKTLTTVLEPALLLFVGILVGFIAVSIISPIYSLTKSFPA